MWRLDPDTPAPPHPQDFLDLKAEVESEHFQGVVRTASRLVWALGLLVLVFYTLFCRYGTVLEGAQGLGLTRRVTRATPLSLGAAASAS